MNGRIIECSPSSKSQRSTLEHRVLRNVSLWSPLKGPLRDWPLCVCDSSTVGLEQDLQTADVIFRDKVAENYQVHYSDRQKWYYVKDQMPGEFLIFRATDTSKADFGAGMQYVQHMMNVVLTNNSAPLLVSVFAGCKERITS